MKRTAALFIATALAGRVAAQGLAELNAAQSGQNALNNAPVSSNVGNIALDRARSLPGAPQPPGGGGLAGLTPPNTQEVPGQAGAPGQATPTPIPKIRVLVGKRVFDAVNGLILEDARSVMVLITDQDKYFDDGIHDNGIPNDGIRGNVETIKDKFIGAESAALMFRMINLVRNAEKMSVLDFYRLHIGETDREQSSGKFPDMLEKERQRDEMLRDWNNRFLADYRIDKNDPKSDFFQVYVPEAPQPPTYPLPPGYRSPQWAAVGRQAPTQQAGGPGGPETPRPNIYNGDAVIGIPGANPKFNDQK